jgi:hypothetical protein
VSHKDKAEGVIEFVNLMLGAFCAGFVKSNTLTLQELIDVRKII